MNRLVLFPLALLLAPVLSAQNIFQRALNNDTMPNLVTCLLYTSDAADE